MNFPDVSIVIPARNEEGRLPKTLEILQDWKKKNPRVIEIIIIIQGNDNTKSIVEDFSKNDPSVKYFIQNDYGKGVAVKLGMLKATGNIILFTDADLSVPVSCLETLINKLENTPEIDGIVGSRKLPQSKIIIKQPLQRRIVSRAFNLSIRLLGLTQIKDTQCGCKLFRKSAAKEIFYNTEISGFAFDLEVILLAKKLGLVLQEEPVTWSDDKRSKVDIGNDGFKALKDVWLLKKTWNKKSIKMHFEQQYQQ